jgi:hypothetical protein
MSDIRQAQTVLAKRTVEGVGEASSSERRAAFNNSGLAQPLGALVDKGWVILPVGADIPREDQARGWFPHKHAAPLARASIVTALVPAAPDARLDHRVHGIGLSDFVVGQRPPRPHLLSKHPPRNRLRRLNTHDFPDAIWITLLDIVGSVIVSSPWSLLALPLP